MTDEPQSATLIERKTASMIGGRAPGDACGRSGHTADAKFRKHGGAGLEAS